MASLVRWPDYILFHISVAGAKDNDWGEQRLRETGPTPIH